MPEGTSLFADVPPDAPPPSNTDEPTCTVCGVVIPWAHTGRRPTKCADHKRASSSTSSTSSRGSVPERELNTACETLAAMYDGILVPLTLVHPHAGATWAQQIEGLNARNRTILANNRDLVKRINAMGTKGGNFAFIASHVFAVAPVGLVLAGSLRAARAEREDWNAEQVPAEDAAFVSGQDGTGVGTGFWEPTAG